ncbi:hypothetical protein Y032_0207g2026 [Ancylostoma ceylanicum]|uniref:Uncharacterized protein n=1 Tax=Ancylostoma ceylanicum TaxID=53326 RepID=A0A016SL04_9BILA|nr:hypothetical protein Y032_0207g2026 [Ancylostoma ceylanicum]
MELNSASHRRFCSVTKAHLRTNMKTLIVVLIVAASACIMATSNCPEKRQKLEDYSGREPFVITTKVVRRGQYMYAFKNTVFLKSRWRWVFGFPEVYFMPDGCEELLKNGTNSTLGFNDKFELVTIYE